MIPTVVFKYSMILQGNGTLYTHISLVTFYGKIDPVAQEFNFYFWFLISSFLLLVLKSLK